MKILITNDDGIQGEGLRTLAVWAKKLGDVTVVAPKVEQSAKSHAIEIHKPFEVRKVDFMDGISAYTVDSTPADCVRFATIGMGQSYDLVLSGINRGLNLGRDIIYSGTVSAVTEAAYLGFPALAFSTEPDSFASAKAQLDGIWELIQKHRLLEQNRFFNINIPSEVRGIRITRMGGPYFSDRFHPIGNDLYQPVGGSIYEDHHDYSIDTDATLHGFISITPLSMDRTNLAVFEALSKLNP